MVFRTLRKTRKPKSPEKKMEDSDVKYPVYSLTLIKMYISSIGRQKSKIMARQPIVQVQSVNNFVLYFLLPYN